MKDGTTFIHKILMNQALKSTLLHTLELGVIFAACWALLNLFDVNSESRVFILGLLVAAVTKFARAEPSIPLKDYVNKK